MKRYYNILKTNAFTIDPIFYIEGEVVQRRGSFNEKVIKSVNKVAGIKQKHVTGIYDRIENKFRISIQL